MHLPRLPNSRRRSFVYYVIRFNFNYEIMLQLANRSQKIAHRIACTYVRAYCMYMVARSAGQIYHGILAVHNAQWDKTK